MGRKTMDRPAPDHGQTVLETTSLLRDDFGRLMIDWNDDLVPVGLVGLVRAFPASCSLC